MTPQAKRIGNYEIVRKLGRGMADVYLAMTGGQVMSTDNAYIEASRVGISTDVAGTVIGVDVKNNEVVKKGQVLYRLKPDSFKIALAAAQSSLELATAS